ncbi:sensor histidine kinase [Streptomyces sp. NPDC088387]|uniref:sensor histidine kinase n=1 Tax=Streptomyces sp. NPDC088387 TaxID=3365859 RepID=UPI0037FBED5F
MPHNGKKPEPAAATANPAVVRTVRSELFSLRPQPLPPLTWPRQLRALPHVLVTAVAVAFSLTGADATARALASGHAATLLVALRWPVAAWWLSTAATVGIVLGHPPSPSNEIWVWMVQASVLFLLALRVRPSAAMTAAVLSSLVGCALKLAHTAVGSWSLVAGGVTLHALATLVGATAQGRREDRRRLTEQIAATAHERALRTVLEERARIARELHDVVAHHMSVISIQADAAPYRVPDPPRELVTELASIRANAQEGLTELRRLLNLLRADMSGPDPDSVAPQPSLAQLDALLANVRAADLDVTTRTEGAPRSLPPGVDLSAYRIVQEALSNVLRHAPGAGANVEITYTREALRVRVTNSPPTHRAPASPGAGHGLTGMRERTAMLGGELAVGSTPDGGYEVTALLPAPAPTTTPTGTPLPAPSLDKDTAQ